MMYVTSHPFKSFDKGTTVVCLKIFAVLFSSQFYVSRIQFDNLTFLARRLHKMRSTVSSHKSISLYMHVSVYIYLWYSWYTKVLNDRKRDDIGLSTVIVNLIILQRVYLKSFQGIVHKNHPIKYVYIVYYVSRH